MKKVYLVFALISIVTFNISAQPHLHIERNLEAARIDGNQSWLSFWDGPAYKGFLWNNQGTMTLGTSDENTAGQLKFVTNHVDRMTINSQGLIGVNTSNPLSLMHIHGDNDILRLSGNQPYISYYNGLGGYVGYLWNKNLFDIELGTSSNNSTGSLFLRTRGNLGIWMDPDGLVGIRKAPTEALDVSGSIRTDLSVIYATTNTNNYWRIFHGTATSQLCFSFNGDIKSCINSANGDFLTSSDQNLKINIQEYEQKILPKIRLLQSYEYEYQDAPGNRTLGFIAQNAQTLFPELVGQISDAQGRAQLAIAYGKVSVIAIKAIQEQQEIIESQQTEINILRKRLDAMEEAIAKINSAPLTRP